MDAMKVSLEGKTSSDSSEGGSKLRSKTTKARWATYTRSAGEMTVTPYSQILTIIL